MLRLSDQRWERIRGHFAEENLPASRAGRKPISSRPILEAVLWILNIGAQWHMLPPCYPSYKTGYRRFRNGCRNEARHNVMTDLANTLHDEGAGISRSALSTQRLPRPKAPATVGILLRQFLR